MHRHVRTDMCAHPCPGRVWGSGVGVCTVYTVYVPPLDKAPLVAELVIEVEVVGETAVEDPVWKTCIQMCSMTNR